MPEPKIERIETPVFETDELGLHFVLYRHDFKSPERPDTMTPFVEVIAYEEWDDEEKKGISLGNFFYNLDTEEFGFVFGCFDDWDDEDTDFLDYEIFRPEFKKLTKLYREQYKAIYDKWYASDYGNVQ